MGQAACCVESREKISLDWNRRSNEEERTQKHTVENVTQEDYENQDLTDFDDSPIYEYENTQQTISKEQIKVKIQLPESGYEFRELNKIIQKIHAESIDDIDAWDFSCLCLYYTRMFSQLGVMGKAMGIAFEDVSSKAYLIRTHLEARPNSAGLLQMIQEELDTNYEVCGELQPVTSSAFRLLWFIELLFQIFWGIANTDQNTSTICIDAYDKVLSKYHPVALQVLAKVCMYTAPKREVISEVITGSSDKEEQKQILDSLCEKKIKLKTKMQNFFNERGIDHLSR